MSIYEVINKNTSPLAPNEAAAMLSWYISVGVDECIENSAIASAKWAAPLELEQPTEQIRPVTANVIPIQSQNDAVSEAKQRAHAATSIAELHASLMDFHGCNLRKTAMNTVFADGDISADVMIIGDGPDAEDDKKGTPFSGPSGKLLDAMLASIGLDRKANGNKGLYISHALFWRPPGNRQPTQEEIDICRPFVEKHIALAAPRILVLAGGTATKALLRETMGISRLRGRIMPFTCEGKSASIPAHIFYPPSFLIRQPTAKRQAWADLLQLKTALKSN